MSSKENYGIVYVLTNPAMPGIVKIGLTNRDSVDLRMRELYSTGVPVPFECVCAYQVEECEKLERALHTAFDPYRINPNREFFKIKPEQAKVIMDLFKKRDITLQVKKEIEDDLTVEDKISGDNLRPKRPRLNFREMGIEAGAILSFIKDPAITVEVKGERTVLFNGEEKTLTPITRQLLGISVSVQPSPYWSYKGRNLKEMYEETYTIDEE